PENILANKITALIDREEPKDFADIWGFCCEVSYDRGLRPNKFSTAPGKRAAGGTGQRTGDVVRPRARAGEMPGGDKNLGIGGSAARRGAGWWAGRRRCRCVRRLRRH
ncbi:MAG: hypothetical protein JXA21_15375, partial [Anaerolineae bacterium]|nr:hypothetical protein [Anaerolineae bacterium]